MRLVSPLLSAAALALLVAACMDTESTTVPGKSLRIPQGSRTEFSGSSNEEVTVAGQTLGPGGSFYSLSGGSRTSTTIYFAPPDTVRVDEYELASTLMPAESTPYYGGDITVAITLNDSTVGAGWVSGDMTRGLGVFTVPAGATVTLEAYTYSGCNFEGWAVNNVYPYVSNSTVYVDSGGSGTRHYTGVFSCM